jgi:hypothetical protein
MTFRHNTAIGKSVILKALPKIKILRDAKKEGNAGISFSFFNTSLTSS